MQDRDPNWPKYERRIGIAVGVNFLAFGIISAMIGGDAINGRIDGNSFILSAHGNDTIVSPLLWHSSATHGAITIVSFLCAFAYMFIKRLVTLNDVSAP